MKRIFISLGLALSVIIAGSITSCKKYMPSINEAEIPNDTTGTVIDTSGSNNAYLDCTVNPLRYNSQYTVENRGATMIHTVLDSIIYEGKKFYGIGFKDPVFGDIIQYVYIGKEGYYVYMDPLAGADIDKALTHKILDFNKRVNDSWSYEHQSALLSNTKYKYTYKITADKIDITFKGHKYTKGYKILSTTDVIAMNTLMGSTKIEYTWICGIGIYENKTDNVVVYKLLDYKY